MKLLSGFSGFIHQEGAEPDFFLSLKALESLNHLERLNLEQTHVRDAALKPLSSFQELRDLSLRSASLTDVSLHYLSSLPKLTNLSIHDAVLSNNGLYLFNPSATLKKMDLYGCWLLTEDAILSFCKKYPQTEVRHELVHNLPSNPNGSTSPSPSQLTSRTLLVNQKQGNISISPSFVGPNFYSLIIQLQLLITLPNFIFNCFEIDQRLKYNREELLARQYSSLSLAIPLDRGSTTSQLLMNQSSYMS